MSTFLNREAIRTGIIELIEDADKELMMIVPYIKISDTTFKYLKEADKRGVEITLLYREESLKEKERERLYGLKNLNLLAHPDIHAKCYFNESRMIIASMNLYDYSERFNREMGILLTNEAFGDNDTYADALEEVRSIVKSAKLEKKSERSKNNGYSPVLLKPAHEKLLVSCRLVNSLFDNKKFEVVPDAQFSTLCCADYFDHMDVIIEPDLGVEINESTGEFAIHRIAVDFKWPEAYTEKIHHQFNKNYDEFMFDHFKIYWDYHKSNLTIYRDRKGQPKWNELNCEQTLKKFKQGINLVTDHVKKIERSLR